MIRSWHHQAWVGLLLLCLGGSVSCALIVHIFGIVDSINRIRTHNDVLQKQMQDPFCDNILFLHHRHLSQQEICKQLKMHFSEQQTIQALPCGPNIQRWQFVGTTQHEQDFLKLFFRFFYSLKGMWRVHHICFQRQLSQSSPPCIAIKVIFEQLSWPQQILWKNLTL